MQAAHAEPDAPPRRRAELRAELSRWPAGSGSSGSTSCRAATSRRRWRAPRASWRCARPPAGSLAAPDAPGTRRGRPEALPALLRAGVHERPPLPVVRRRLSPPPVARAGGRGARAERDPARRARLPRRASPATSSIRGSTARSTASSATSTARSTTSSRASATSSTAACPRPSQPERAERDPRPGRPPGRHELGEHQPVAGGQPVDQRTSAAALGRVDRGDQHGYAAAELEERVAVRRVVAVEAPDPPQRGRARDARRAQPADQRVRERLAAGARLLAADHRQLAPPARRGVRVRSGERRAVALADADALERPQRLAEQRVELGQRRGDPVRRADGDDEQRHVRGSRRRSARGGGARARCRRPRAARSPPRRRGGAAGRRARRARPPARAVAAAGHDRELRLLARPRRDGRGRRALERDQPVPGERRVSSAAARIAAGASVASATSGRSSGASAAGPCAGGASRRSPRCRAEQARAQAAPRVRRHQGAVEHPGGSRSPRYTVRVRASCVTAPPQLAAGPGGRRAQHQAHALR